MSDIIRIHDLRRLARHGVYDEERAEGRRFAVDVEATVATAEAGRSDALGDTVDYTALAGIVVDVLDGPSMHLIEALAQRMCDRMFAEHPRVEHVRLNLRKVATDVPGDPAWVGLTIERTRG